MSDKKTYSPFDPIGRYNLKLYFYDNKPTVISLTVLFILFLFMCMYFIWGNGRDTPKPQVKVSRVPPPKYGYGPYGYGLYAPPKEIFDYS